MVVSASGIFGIESVLLPVSLNDSTGIIGLKEHLHVFYFLSLQKKGLPEECSFNMVP